MCKSILIHSSVSLLLVLVLMLACHAVARLRRPKAGARTLAKNRKVFILLSISRTWGRSLSFSITSMSKSKNLHDKALASLAPPFNVHDPRANARVVEWQTRTFEGRMPKGMRVQVPPRAPRAAPLFASSRFPSRELGQDRFLHVQPVLRLIENGLRMHFESFLLDFLTPMRRQAMHHQCVGLGQFHERLVDPVRPQLGFA